MSSHASGSGRPRSVRGRVAGWLTAGVLAGGLYLLLIDTTSLPELIVAAGASIIAATGYELAREQTPGGIGFRMRWLTNAHRALRKVPADIAFVSLAAFKQLVRPHAVNGRFRAVPFHRGPEHDSGIGRMALAESLGSFAPNTIIVGVDVERELILGHQLVPSGGDDAIDVLGLSSK